MWQLRLLQEAIKREEDSIAEEHRKEIQARAAADEEAKFAYYDAKHAHREQRLQQVLIPEYPCCGNVVTYPLRLAYSTILAHLKAHSKLQLHRLTPHKRHSI